jgi:hypothetical protein
VLPEISGRAEQRIAGPSTGGTGSAVVAHQPGTTADSPGGRPTQFGGQRGNRYTLLPGAPSPDWLSFWPVW